MKLEQLEPFGAHVRCDLSTLSLEDIAALSDALQSHGVLYFSQQRLAPEDLVLLLSRFPDVDEAQLDFEPFAQGDPSCLPELPLVRALGTLDSEPTWHRKAIPETNAMGLEWHSDGLGLTALYAVQVPDERSAKRTTCWVSGYSAWDVLDSEMKQKALQMQGRYGPRHMMEASVAEIYRRGGRMTENGLKDSMT